jgi:hypothetical protein
MYGLIAEEVAEVYPDLVVYGRDGQPETGAPSPGQRLALKRGHRAVTDRVTVKWPFSSRAIILH